MLLFLSSMIIGSGDYFPLHVATKHQVVTLGNLISSKSDVTKLLPVSGFTFWLPPCLLVSLLSFSSNPSRLLFVRSFVAILNPTSRSNAFPALWMHVATKWTLTIAASCRSKQRQLKKFKSLMENKILMIYISAVPLVVEKV